MGVSNRKQEHMSEERIRELERLLEANRADLREAEERLQLLGEAIGPNAPSPPDGYAICWQDPGEEKRRRGQKGLFRVYVRARDGLRWAWTTYEDAVRAAEAHASTDCESPRAELRDLSLALLELDENYELRRRSYLPWAGPDTILVQIAARARKQSLIECLHPEASRVSLAHVPHNFGQRSFQCRECRFIHYDSELDRGLAPGEVEDPTEAGAS